MSDTFPEHWHRDLWERVRRASVGLQKNWPDAWLFLGDDTLPWYDSDLLLLGLPVFQTPATLKHSGHDGEPQLIVPLWMNDPSNKVSLIREFEARLAESGDY